MRTSVSVTLALFFLSHLPGAGFAANAPPSEGAGRLPVAAEGKASPPEQASGGVGQASNAVSCPQPPPEGGEAFDAPPADGCPAPTATTYVGQEEVYDTVLTNADASFGLYLLRPYWSKRNFSISVPGETGGTILGDSRDVTHDYSAAPIGEVAFTFKDYPALSFKGFNLNLSSQLDRTFISGATTASLTATNSLSITEFNALELPFPIKPWGFLNGCVDDRHGITFSAGPRYTQVKQDYHALLTAGMNSTALDAHQDFTGFGGTSSVEIRSKECCCLTLYGNLRGSILYGTNNKNGSLVTTGATPVQMTESRTDFVPIGEVEVGVEWRPRVKVFGVSCRTPTDPQLGIRAAFLGQVIGDVGLPSPASHDQRAFDNGAVYLAGLGVQFGVRY
jgi:hypothetical protein